MEAERSVAVSLRGVRKSFGAGQATNPVLRGIDLDIYFGELFFLVGPSGSGKTTLMTILAAMLDADEGKVTVFGQSMERLSEAERTDFRRSYLGFVFQQFNLIPSLAANENAAIPLLIRGVPRRRALHQAEDLLAAVGMEKQRRLRPSQLSGGQQQRVAIVRALLAEPRLLICDEPTASLDGETGKQIMEIVRSRVVSADRCVVLVTHDNRIFPYSDRIAEMRDGLITGIEDTRR